MLEAVEVAELDCESELFVSVAEDVDIELLPDLDDALEKED